MGAAVARLPKDKPGYGKAILVTFDEGVWYWNSILWTLDYIPSGRQRATFREGIRSQQSNNHKKATIRILQLELKRCKGELTMCPEGLN